MSINARFSIICITLNHLELAVLDEDLLQSVFNEFLTLASLSADRDLFLKAFDLPLQTVVDGD